MIHPPHTLQEAENLCTRFRHLVGKRYDTQTTDRITDIVVAPFDQLNKERFLAHYLLINNMHPGTYTDYKGLLFDVLVIAACEDGLGLKHESLHVWMENYKPGLSGDSMQRTATSCGC